MKERKKKSKNCGFNRVPLISHETFMRAKQEGIIYTGHFLRKKKELKKNLNCKNRLTYPAN